MAKGNKEIERWFVPRYALLPELRRGTHIVQGYLRENPTIRVRLEGHYDGSRRADITIKGKKTGIGRTEIIIKIPVWLGKFLLRFSTLPLVRKCRYLVPSGLKHPWEIDVFIGANDGLIKIEIELESEDEVLPSPLPEWILEEVTDDSSYGNKYLAKNPFCNWSEEKKRLGR